MKEEQKPYGTVLIKAKSILDSLVNSKAATLKEIAMASNISQSTTSKILDTLVLIGYVRKNDTQKTYRIGSAFLAYSRAYLADFDIISLTEPALLKLRDKYDETVHLGVPEGNEIVYINKLPSHQPITLMSSRIGNRIPLYCSAMGKAVLSEMSNEEVNNYYQWVHLLALTPNTITNVTTLKQDILATKKRHLAYDNEEREIDVYCIAATIMYQGIIRGTFSISIPTYRLTEELKQKMMTSMIETKANIEATITDYYR